MVFEMDYSQIPESKTLFMQSLHIRQYRVSTHGGYLISVVQRSWYIERFSCRRSGHMRCLRTTASANLQSGESYCVYASPTAVAHSANTRPCLRILAEQIGKGVYRNNISTLVNTTARFWPVSVQVRESRDSIKAECDELAEHPDLTMSRPNTEIIIFPTSEAFRSDPDLLVDGVVPLSKAEGLLR